jgi:hypothetical protein
VLFGVVGVRGGAEVVVLGGGRVGGVPGGWVAFGGDHLEHFEYSDCDCNATMKLEC